MLMEHLRKKTSAKSCFSLADLKRKFPKDKKEIKHLVFLGLIEPVSIEFPDTVRAQVFS